MDNSGEPIDLADVTKADPMNFNLGLKYKGLSIRSVYDVFETQEPFTFVSYKNYYADIKYDYRINKKLAITPQVKYFNQIPWQYGDVETGETTLKARAERMYGSVTGVYDVSRKININAGLLYFHDKATDLLKSGYFLDGNSLEFNNYAVFAQALLKHRLVNATVGFRYERNNRYGSAFVPRIALTKKIENFHFKILYSQAFRAPAIENINLAASGDGSIDPEKSNVIELELGYQFTPEMLLAINAFNIRTNDIIVYDDTSTGGNYVNYDKSGSSGVEAVYSVRKKHWYLNLTYSYARALSGDGIVQTYVVPQTSHQYAGFSAHKLTLNTSYALSPKIHITPTVIYGGPRYAFTTLDADGNAVAEKLDAYLLGNLFFNFSDIITPGLTAGIGVYDILNERPSVPQAYLGEYAPVPGRSREYVVKLSYQLNFKKH
jgi:hypothetical protein